MSSDDADLEIRWLTESAPLPLEAEAHEEIRLKDRRLFLVDAFGNEEAYNGDAELFGTWEPCRALVVRSGSRPDKMVLLGEEGSVLLRLDIPVPTRIAEVPRFPDETGGMCYISVFPTGEVTLLHWELGVIVLDGTFELLWRQDLEWNHEIVHLDDREIWFDFHYDSETEKVGTRPWGFSMSTGHELFDRRPPSSRLRPKPLPSQEPDAPTF
jgi:hypothetical protein